MRFPDQSTSECALIAHNAVAKLWMLTTIRPLAPRRITSCTLEWEYGHTGHVSANPARTAVNGWSWSAMFGFPAAGLDVSWNR